MSIIISNITEQKGGVYGQGLQHYVVKINTKVIAEYTHQFRDGLAICLQKASVAVADPHRLEVQNENAFLESLTKQLALLDR